MHMQITYKNNNANHRRQSLSHQTNKSKNETFIIYYSTFYFYSFNSTSKPGSGSLHEPSQGNKTNEQRKESFFSLLPGNSQLKTKVKEIIKDMCKDVRSQQKQS